MPDISREDLSAAIQHESERFKEAYEWLKSHMSKKFFDDVSRENLFSIIHTLMGFHLENYFSIIQSADHAIVLCLDEDDADLKVLKQFNHFSINHFRTYISNTPRAGTDKPLRIALLYFSDSHESETGRSKEELMEVFHHLSKHHPDFSQKEFNALMSNMSPRFLSSFTTSRLSLALNMYLRAKTRDHCQYEITQNTGWTPASPFPSYQIALAWRDAPKFSFIYKIAKLIRRHNLVMTKVNATYVDPISSQNVLVMSLGLNGKGGVAAWEAADMDKFLSELVTIKYFEGQDLIENTFIDSSLLDGNLGNFLKTSIYFIHQCLVHKDPNMYTLARIEETLCKQSDLTLQVAKAFDVKFNPKHHSLAECKAIEEKFFAAVKALDTGYESTDTLHKNVLTVAMNFVHFTLKTNLFRTNKVAHSFRLDPRYLDTLPFDRAEKFPELPYGIFFMRGMGFLGFQIRFKDLARGGFRTVLPTRPDQYANALNNVFTDCYGLSYTQQKKNKDIPEGGSKAIALLTPYDVPKWEERYYRSELLKMGITPADLDKKFADLMAERRLEHIYTAQRCFIDSFMSLILCDDEGHLKQKDIVSYYPLPEYIYLGPDENMYNPMIEWIANFSKQCGYKPGSSFMSSKPSAGINHKEYGVTSLGVSVYVDKLLKYLKIDTENTPFTIKMSGGPDGDVAGNMMLLLKKNYPKTAKLITLVDGSGTAYDPKGFDLDELIKLFHAGKPINCYPHEKLSPGGFILDIRARKSEGQSNIKTRIWKNIDGKIHEEWISGSESNHIFRSTILQTKTDIFITGGGLPRTLNDSNWKDYLDKEGHPTSRGIVEGANLYLTPLARRSLEKLGVLIIKDSSANKGGVICSSYEILTGLTLGSDDLFIKEKPALMPEVIALIKKRASDEADLLLKTHAETGDFLTDISEWISERINTYTYAILDHLVTLPPGEHLKGFYQKCLLSYCPHLLSTKYKESVLGNVPSIHQKAIIACHIASKTVYTRGITWTPTIIDALRDISEDPAIN